MKILNQQQRDAIGTLQDAHGAVLGMLDYLKSDAPAWVAENARKTINDSIAACKVTSPLLADDGDECCIKCKFWDQFYEDPVSKAGAGCCVRYAPRPVITKEDNGEDNGEDNVVWPITRENQKCGDFCLPNS